MPVQEVIINGKPLDLDYEPSLQIGKLPNWRTPIEINGKMVHGVNINGYDYPPCDTGCVLYLPGLPGQGATIWDRSNQANHGEITGAVWSRLPSGLWVQNFDGDDYVDCGNPVSLQLQYFTVLVWARATTADSDLFSHAANTASGWHLTLTSTIRVVTGDNYLATINDINPGVNPLDGTFRLWGFDRATDNSCHLTMNGVVLDTDTYAGVFGFTGNLLLGCRNSTLGNFLTGSIGKVSIYNRVLSAGEIANIFNRERHLFGV